MLNHNDLGRSTLLNLLLAAAIVFSGWVSATELNTAPITVDASTESAVATESANAQDSQQLAALNADAATDLAQPTQEQPLSKSKTALRRKLNQYLNEIEVMESQQGAYGNGLSEQLSGLGKTYQDLGLHTDAIEVFKRAAHLSRVNDGLYSLNQVPIVESIIDSQIQRGMWEEASQSKRYIHWLYENNYDADDPQLLPVLASLSSWYLSYHAMQYNMRSLSLVIDANNMYLDSLRIVHDNYGAKDLRNADILRGLVKTNWYFNSAYNLQDPNPVSVTTQTGASFYLDDSGQDRLTRLIQFSRHRGKAAIEKLIELYADNPDAPPGAEAGATVELADWNLIFGDRLQALNIYKDAYSMLVQDEREQVRRQVEKLFGRPVALPDLPLLESIAGTDSPEMPSTGYVEVSFDVTKYGTTRNIDITESMPENNVPKRKYVKDLIRNTIFRPRFIDGEPVATEHLVHRYVFND